ncbi:hypothetical protein [Paenibacillus aestuarii]|uniref:Small, acid-soluble spore protein, alpha/beta type n=1 Tax=Paenibacillus aestuarii TaxID=516965 RepID=A0ABW0K3F6_9BACL|nr:hypothetical protein [Paenibacillus aestuarii]
MDEKRKVINDSLNKVSAKMATPAEKKVTASVDKLSARLTDSGNTKKK